MTFLKLSQAKNKARHSPHWFPASASVFVKTRLQQSSKTRGPVGSCLWKRAPPIAVALLSAKTWKASSGSLLYIGRCNWQLILTRSVNFFWAFLASGVRTNLPFLSELW